MDTFAHTSHPVKEERKQREVRATTSSRPSSPFPPLPLHNSLLFMTLGVAESTSLVARSHGREAGEEGEQLVSRDDGAGRVAHSLLPRGRLSRQSDGQESSIESMNWLDLQKSENTFSLNPQKISFLHFPISAQCLNAFISAPRKSHLL